MKTLNRILKTIKIPFKLMCQVGSIPVKFVYSKQKKLIKIISPSNVKIVAVKISRAGNKIIVTFALIVSIISRSGVENQKMIESSCIFPAKMSIERVIGLPNGGAINQITHGLQGLNMRLTRLKFLVVKLQIYVLVDF